MGTSLPSQERTAYLGSALAVLVLSVVYFAAVVAPIVAAVRTTDAQWFSGGGSLFGYLVAFVGYFTGSGVPALYFAAAVVYVLTPFAAFLFLFKAFRKYLVAATGSVLLLAYPGYFGAAAASAYGPVAALLFLLLSLYLSLDVLASPTPERLTVFAVFAFATAAASPITGFILAVALVPMALRRQGGLRLYALSLPSAACILSAICYFLVSPGPLLQWSFESDVVLARGAIGSVLSLFVLRKEGLSQQLLRLAAYAIGSLVLTILSAEPFVVYPLVLLSSGTIIYAHDAVKSVAQGGDTAVEIDVVKAAAIGVLVLMLLASAGTTFAQTQSFASDRSFSDRYGSSSLLQAMDWLKSNTPSGSLVLAEYPLSQWVQTVAVRPVLTDLPVSPNSSQFTRSYDASTILNATNEMSNGYFRVRDWAPVAPQRSPVIGVSEGNQYVDFLYNDENHFGLLNSTGGVIPIPYAERPKLQSGFVDANGTTELVEVYTYSGATVEQDISLGSGAEATITYAVTYGSGSGMTGAQLKLWVPWDRQIGFSQVQGRTLALDLDVGHFTIAASGPVSSMKFGQDPVWGQPEVTLVASARSSFEVTIRVSASDIRPVTWSTGFTAVSDTQLLSKYQVAFAVIPTAVKTENLDRFGTYFPTYTSVFQNDKLTIYRINLSPT